MSTRFSVSLLLVLAFSTPVFSQNPQSDPRAITLATKAITALTSGSAISDVRLTANIEWIAGPKPEPGTGIFLAKGNSESRIDLSLNSTGKRTEIRNSFNGPAGQWINADGKSGNYASHNCWTDEVWFLPELSSLANSSDPRFIFSYVGQETWNGLSTQHLRVYQAQNDFKQAQQLSAMDFYLDPTSLVVLGIAYKTHPDSNMNVDLPAEIRFADFRPVHGIQVPLHVQRLQSGAVMLDITVTGASFNTGVRDDEFLIQ